MTGPSSPYDPAFFIAYMKGIREMPKKEVPIEDKKPDSLAEGVVSEDQPNGIALPEGGNPLNPTYEEDPMMAAANEALGGKEELPPDSDMDKLIKEPEEEKKEESKEKPSSEEEKKEVIPPSKEEEKTKEQSSKLTKEQEEAISFRENFYNSKEYRQQIAKKMAEMGEIKLAEDKPQADKPTEIKQETDPDLADLDPEVLSTIDKIISRKTNVLDAKLKELDSYISKAKEADQKRQIDNAQKEFVEFKKENKELITKHEKALIATGNKYPDLLRSGKEGLSSLLKLVAHDDIIEQRVREGIEAALKRSSTVQGNVQKYSHSKGTSSNIQNDNSIKKGATFEECAEAAWRQRQQGV